MDIVNNKRFRYSNIRAKIELQIKGYYINYKRISLKKGGREDIPVNFVGVYENI